MHTSRLPEATLKEPATLPGGRNKAFWRSVQAFCPLRTSILPAPHKQSARTEQARWTDGACTAAASGSPKVLFRPLFRVFCRRLVSAKSCISELFASFLRLIRTRLAYPSGQENYTQGCTRSCLSAIQSRMKKQRLSQGFRREP